MVTQERVRLSLDIVGTLAMVIACAVLVSHRMSMQSELAALGAEGGGSPIAEVNLKSTAKASGLGATTAKVAVIEFADFQCPFCSQFALTTQPTLKRTFIDTGDVHYSFRHFPLESIHPLALKASAAVECAGEQRKYWEMHDALFANPRQLAEGDLVKHALNLKIDESTFRKCLDTDPNTVKEDLAEGHRLGVQGTPTFFIGHKKADGTVDIVRRLTGNIPYDMLKVAINDVLGRQS